MAKIFCPYTDEQLAQIKPRAKELFSHMFMEQDEIKLDGVTVGRIVNAGEQGYVGLRLLGEKYSAFLHTFDTESDAVTYTKRQIAFAKAVNEILSPDEFTRIVNSLWDMPKGAVLVDDYVALKHLKPRNPG